MLLIQGVQEGKFMKEEAGATGSWKRWGGILPWSLQRQRRPPRPWPQNSGLHDCERENFCCYNPPTLGSCVMEASGNQCRHLPMILFLKIAPIIIQVKALTLLMVGVTDKLHICFVLFFSCKRTGAEGEYMRSVFSLYLVCLSLVNSTSKSKQKQTSVYPKPKPSLWGVKLIWCYCKWCNFFCFCRMRCFANVIYRQPKSSVPNWHAVLSALDCLESTILPPFASQGKLSGFAAGRCLLSVTLGWDSQPTQHTPLAMLGCLFLIWGMLVPGFQGARATSPPPNLPISTALKTPAVDFQCNIYDVPKGGFRWVKNHQKWHSPAFSLVSVSHRTVYSFA